MRSHTASPGSCTTTAVGAEASIAHICGGEGRPHCERRHRLRRRVVDLHAGMFSCVAGGRICIPCCQHADCRRAVRRCSWHRGCNQRQSIVKNAAVPECAVELTKPICRTNPPATQGYMQQIKQGCSSGTRQSQKVNFAKNSAFRKCNFAMKFSTSRTFITGNSTRTGSA